MQVFFDSALYRTDEHGEEVEIEVDVEANFSPSTPDVWYLANGDPGYPGDAEEIELTKIQQTGGFLPGADYTDEVLANRKELEHFEDQVRDHLPEPDYDDGGRDE